MTKGNMRSKNTFDPLGDCCEEDEQITEHFATLRGAMKVGWRCVREELDSDEEDIAIIRALTCKHEFRLNSI